MTKITSISQLDPDGYYTYQDYISWKFKERVELLKGYLAKMSPAPNRKHQMISGNLYFYIKSFLLNKKCQVYSAPFDVRLPVSREEGKTDTVVQPDLCIICDETKLDEQGCNGSPDVVIEILSPGNSSREMRDKFKLYEASLIPEYWIVDPHREDIIIYALNNDNEYIGSRPFLSGDILTSHTFPNLTVEVSAIFRP